MGSVCIYCGASDQVDTKYLDLASRMGEEAATRGLQIVYGGGSTGLMGALADGALSANGEVIGIVPEIFNTSEKAHDKLTRLEIVVDMHQRKARMAELVDAFIALPGGFGTLEELFEVLTWAQIGLHNKPVGLLNYNGYFDKLIEFLQEVEEKKFIHTPLMSLVQVSDSPNALLDMIGFQEHPNKNASLKAST